MKKEHPLYFKILADKFHLQDDWLETNNFNLVSSGKLAYVDGDVTWWDHTQKYETNDSDYYRKRAWESLRKTAEHYALHPLDYYYAVDQHSKCYLEYLKFKASKIDLKNANLDQNCL